MRRVLNANLLDYGRQDLECCPWLGGGRARTPRVPMRNPVPIVFDLFGVSDQHGIDLAFKQFEHLVEPPIFDFVFKFSCKPTRVFDRMPVAEQPVRGLKMLR